MAESGNGLCYLLPANRALALFLACLGTGCRFGYGWIFNLMSCLYNYKMASAIGIIVFIICAVFTLVAFNRMIKGDKEGTYQ